MRRWAVDRCRLALRKVLPRLLAFAFTPTKGEFDAIVAKIFGQVFDAPTAAPSVAADRQRLH